MAWTLAPATTPLCAIGVAMAIAFVGLQPDELQRWTDAMIASGERLDFSGLSRK